MGTEEKQETRFRELSAQYLMRQSLSDLRSYGRFLNLPTPTRLKKAELVHQIIDVLCGECNPIRTRRGAPIKNNYFSDDIPKVIEKIKEKTNIVSAVEKEQQTVEVEKDAVLLHFHVSIEKLNDNQKELLYLFLKSL